MARTTFLTLAVMILCVGADAQISESERRHEESDIAKIVAITRADHSTIFFTGLIGGGYVRDGDVSMLTSDSGDFYSRPECYGSAVSRDGSRFAYAAPSSGPTACRIVLHDLGTGEEKPLAETGLRPHPMSWSWDDSEIVYQAADGIVAVSIADGTKHIVGRLPLRINGKIPTEGWQLFSIERFHRRPELMLDAMVCIPTREPGTCEQQRQVLLLSSDDSRVLEMGANAAVSPAGDSIAFFAKNGVVVVDADGSNRRVVTHAASTLFFLPFLKEESWTTIVWSPGGERLWFNTIIDEGGNTDAYLVDVKRGRRRQILRHSMIIITAWRASIHADSSLR